MSKSEIWKNFVDALSTAVDKRNEYKKKQDKHIEGGSYCPFSETWVGSILSKEATEAEYSLVLQCLNTLVTLVVGPFSRPNTSGSLVRS
jgi:hypothetical protein